MAFGVGMVVFILTVLVIFGLGHKKNQSPDHAVEAHRGPPEAAAASEQLDEEPRDERHDIVDMVERGDWAGARRTLQKWAYGMLGASGEQKRQFTSFVAEFARVDPLYRECIEVVRPVIAERPGIKQTELYAHMPVGDVEEARYVLYFAHEIGDIARRKKGNTYEVFPANFAVELVAPVAAKRRRPRKSSQA